MVSDSQSSTVEHYVSAGQEENAKLIAGDARVTGAEYDKGYFYQPTIFDHVDNQMKIAEEESAPSSP